MADVVVFFRNIFTLNLIIKKMFFSKKLIFWKKRHLWKIWKNSWWYSQVLRKYKVYIQDAHSNIVRNMDFFVKWCAWNYDLRSTASDASSTNVLLLSTFSRTLLSWMRRYWFYVKNDFRNFHQIFTFWDTLSQKKWFLRKCLSVCLSVCRSCAA